MSIEEVIDFLKSKKKLYSQMDESDRKDYVMECLDTAINLLSNMTDGDLISRQAVLALAKDLTFEGGCKHRCVDVTKIHCLPSAEKTANKININEYVKVKLTDYGKEIFYHQYDNINKTYGKEIIKPSYPTVDSDGYTSFQLWYFINLYGRYIDMGVQNVIEPLEIVFESAEKTAEWISHKEDDLAINDYQCSKCDYWTEYNTKYCPNCGRKMKGAEL